MSEQADLSAGEIATHFPQVSRVAVSKHLGVLRSAGLVRSRARGQEVHYTLDPRPLAEMYETWLRRFEPLWEQSLRNLKRVAEEDPGRS